MEAVLPSTAKAPKEKQVSLCVSGFEGVGDQASFLLSGFSYRRARISCSVRAWLADGLVARDWRIA